jgi:hypothetical protein
MFVGKKKYEELEAEKALITIDPHLNYACIREKYGLKGSASASGTA